MNSKHHNPNAHVPQQSADDPRGDRGPEGETWKPPSGAQGISNRPDDAEEGAEPTERNASEDRDELIEDDVALEERRNAERERQAGGDQLPRNTGE